MIILSNKDNVGKILNDVFKILDYKTENRKSYYYIECLRCRNKKWIRCDSLKRIVSCGCYNKDNNYLKSLDLTDREFGKLKAIKDIGTDGKNHIWECICECGNTCYTSAYLLTRGSVSSCGCIKNESNLNNLEKAHESCKSFIKDGTNYKIINNKNPFKNNESTGERCITYDKSRGKYVVQMKYKGNVYFSKRYDTLEEAIKIRDQLFKNRKDIANETRSE